MTDTVTKTPPPKTGLQRSATFQMRAADGDDATDGLTLEGYAAVFDAPTRIDSWEGSFEETIAKGAFAKTLRENTPILQFDHGHHPLIGSIPIGAIRTLKEEPQGLFVKARLTDNWLIQPVRDAIRDGGITGMSFRFSVVREEWRDNAGKLVKDTELLDLLWNPGDRGPLQRTLKELKLSELGPVVWPAYEQTSVGVRGLEMARSLQDPATRADFARALLLHTSDEQPPPCEPTTEDNGSESDDAPRQHSSDRGSEPDAPPTPGHPSIPVSSDANTRLSKHINEIAALTGDVVASITKDTNRHGAVAPAGSDSPANHSR